MSLTIAYFTCRKDPKIEWFFRSLNRELKSDWKDVKIMIIDYWLQYEPNRYDDIKKHWCHFTNNVLHISPKPCPIQGKYKVSKNEYFAASNARNTAFIYCDTNYIVCIDDLTVLKEGWIKDILWAKQNNYVIYGSYAKVKNLNCDDNGSYTFDQEGIQLDSRYNSEILKQDGPTKVAGSWLFGCSFGLPLSLAMAVDGFDESCDGQGAEDYDFGIRIGRLTNNIFYSKAMFTYEDDDLHFAPGNAKFIRESKILTNNTLMKNKIGLPSDHAMLQYVMSSKHLPFRPNMLFNIKQNINNIEVITSAFPNMLDWRDGTRLSDL